MRDMPISAASTPFPLRDFAPTELREVLLNLRWSLDRLHDLELPAECVPTSVLAWQLGLPWWKDGAHYFAVSPNAVRADPVRYRAQWERTMRSDVSSPVHVIERPVGTVVLDGLHRLLKLVVLGREEVPVKRVPMEAVALIVEP
jgi:hypothetical protein